MDEATSLATHGYDTEASREFEQKDRIQCSGMLNNSMAMASRCLQMTSFSR